MGMEEVARAEQSLGRQPLVLLPSLCFGAPFSLQPDGKQVFITPAGKLVCPHGELSSTISYWLASEKKARLEGLPIPPRGGSRGRSSCDCQSTEGLNVKPDASTAPPPPPASLFQFLQDTGAELTTVKGREARRIPHIPGPMFVTTLGKLCCRHGVSPRIAEQAAEVLRALIAPTGMPMRAQVAAGAGRDQGATARQVRSVQGGAAGRALAVMGCTAACGEHMCVRIQDDVLV